VVPETTWQIDPHLQATVPYWDLVPKSHEILGTQTKSGVTFAISKIVTSFVPGTTLLYLQHNDIPGYNDGYTALQIRKQLPVPTIIDFKATKSSVDWGESFELVWETR